MMMIGRAQLKSCEIMESLYNIKQLESEVRKLREGRAPFTNIATFGAHKMKIKEFLGSMRLKLNQRKEEIQEEKALQKELKKSHQMEMQKALPKFEIIQLNNRFCSLDFCC